MYFPSGEMLTSAKSVGRTKSLMEGGPAVGAVADCLSVDDATRVNDDNTTPNATVNTVRKRRGITIPSPWHGSPDPCRGCYRFDRAMTSGESCSAARC